MKTVIRIDGKTEQCRMSTLAQQLASNLRSKHLQTPSTVNFLVSEYLPHGSGIDGKIAVDLTKSNEKKIVIDFEYHCMDGNGYYCGWRNYTVIVTPSFTGIEIRITGRDFNDVKEYFYQIFEASLNTPVIAYTNNGARYVRERMKTGTEHYETEYVEFIPEYLKA